jgi:hypothetical protein
MIEFLVISFRQKFCQTAQREKNIYVDILGILLFTFDLAEILQKDDKTFQEFRKKVFFRKKMK